MIRDGDERTETATARALIDVLVSHTGSTGYSDNSCDAVFAVARALHVLGNSDAGGAIERLASEVKDGSERIAAAISGLGTELHGVGQEIGWGLDPDDNRSNHLCVHGRP